jgi:hypothetical protein
MNLGQRGYKGDMRSGKARAESTRAELTRKPLVSLEEFSPSELEIS